MKRRATAILVLLGAVAGLVLGARWAMPPATGRVVTVCAPTTAALSELTAFPVSLENQLTVEGLCAYEGRYLEDGGCEEVCDVAGLIVYNAGDRPIRTVQVRMQTSNGEFCFRGSWILPQQRCVLLEADKKRYRGEQEGRCEAQVIPEDRSDLLGQMLTVSAGADDAVILTNQSRQTFATVRILYKTYLEQTDTFMGGITYEWEEQNLLPGQSREIRLPNYAFGYTRVIAVFAESLPDAV